MRFKSALAIVLLGLSAAHAADFAAAIDGPDGKPIPACAAHTPECERPTTLGQIASAALFAEYADEAGGPGTLTADQKVRRAALGLRVRDAGKLDLSAEDTALIKLVVGKAYAPIVVLRAFTLLDPSSVPAEKPKTP